MMRIPVVLVVVGKPRSCKRFVITPTFLTRTIYELCRLTNLTHFAAESVSVISSLSVATWHVRINRHGADFYVFYVNNVTVGVFLYVWRYLRNGLPSVATADHKNRQRNWQCMAPVPQRSAAGSMTLHRATLHRANE